MNETPQEVNLRQIRHNFYDWLDSIGVPNMKEGEANRLEVSKFLQVYADLRNEKLKKELGLAMRTNAERAAARKAKAQRKAERRKAQQVAA